jgi:hypothetical protein
MRKGASTTIKSSRSAATPDALLALARYFRTLRFETATYVQPADGLLRGIRNIYLIFQLYL